MPSAVVLCPTTERFLDTLLESRRNSKTSAHARIYILIYFDAYRRKLAKRLYTFMDNVGLLEPASEAFECIAMCTTKAPQLLSRLSAGIDNNNNSIYIIAWEPLVTSMQKKLCH